MLLSRANSNVQAVCHSILEVFTGKSLIYNFLRMKLTARHDAQITKVAVPIKPFIFRLKRIRHGFLSIYFMNCSWHERTPWLHQMPTNALYGPGLYVNRKNRATSARTTQIQSSLFLWKCRLLIISDYNNLSAQWGRVLPSWVSCQRIHCWPWSLVFYDNDD